MDNWSDSLKVRLVFILLNISMRLTRRIANVGSIPSGIGPGIGLWANRASKFRRYSCTGSKLVKAVVIVARSHLERRGLHPDESEMKLVDRAGEVVPIR